MGAALPVAAIALVAGGKIMEGMGEAKSLRAGARADMENARLSLLSGERDSLDIRRQERRQAGAALASLGSSGTMIGQDSAADVIADSAWQRELSIAAARREARGQARNHELAAKDKRRAARAAIVKGVFGAVSSAVSGAGGMQGAGG